MVVGWRRNEFAAQFAATRENVDYIAPRKTETPETMEHYTSWEPVQGGRWLLWPWLWPSSSVGATSSIRLHGAAPAARKRRRWQQTEPVTHTSPAGLTRPIFRW